MEGPGLWPMKRHQSSCVSLKHRTRKAKSPPTHGWADSARRRLVFDISPALILSQFNLVVVATQLLCLFASLAPRGPRETKWAVRVCVRWHSVDTYTMFPSLVYIYGDIIIGYLWWLSNIAPIQRWLSAGWDYRCWEHEEVVPPPTTHTHTHANTHTHTHTLWLSFFSMCASAGTVGTAKHNTKHLTAALKKCVAVLLSGQTSRQWLSPLTSLL